VEKNRGRPGCKNKLAHFGSPIGWMNSRRLSCRVGRGPTWTTRLAKRKLGGEEMGRKSLSLALFPRPRP